MDRHDPFSIAHAIVALNAWEKAARHNWALVPQTSADPYIVSVVLEKAPPVKARLLLFPGLTVFRDYMLTRRFADFGVYMSLMDFPHFELLVTHDGTIELFSHRPGFVPVRPSSIELAFLAPLLYECYGVMLRLEQEPDLPLTYAEKNALFARKESVPDVWCDGPLGMPKEEVINLEEHVAVDRRACEEAKVLPIFPKERWEIDFVMVPLYRTPGPDPRFLYLLAAVDAESGEKMVWEKMSVDGKPDGLKRLWEGHAQRLLDAIRKRGRVPGEIHVRSPRMARFLRPLGLHLPFKLVQHAKLPSLEGVLNLSIQTRKV